MLRDRFHVWGEREGRGGHGFRGGRARIPRLPRLAASCSVGAPWPKADVIRTDSGAGAA